MIAATLDKLLMDSRRLWELTTGSNSCRGRHGRGGGLGHIHDI